MERKETKHLNTDKRPERISIDGRRPMFVIPNPNPNFHYTWQREADVQDFLRAGYEYVDDPGLPEMQTVNSASRINAPGNALILRFRGDVMYALKLLNELWLEDEDRREKARLDVEIQMQRLQEGEYGKVTIGKHIRKIEK